MAKAAGKLPLPPPSTSAPLLDSTVARRVYPPLGCGAFARRTTFQLCSNTRSSQRDIVRNGL